MYCDTVINIIIKADFVVHSNAFRVLEKLSFTRRNPKYFKSNLFYEIPFQSDIILVVDKTQC